MSIIWDRNLMSNTPYHKALWSNMCMSTYMPYMQKIYITCILIEIQDGILKVELWEDEFVEGLDSLSHVFLRFFHSSNSGWAATFMAYWKAARILHSIEDIGVVFVFFSSPWLNKFDSKARLSHKSSAAGHPHPSDVGFSQHQEHAIWWWLGLFDDGRAQKLI